MRVMKGWDGIPRAAVAAPPLGESKVSLEQPGVILGIVERSQHLQCGKGESGNWRGIPLQELQSSGQLKRWKFKLGLAELGLAEPGFPEPGFPQPGFAQPGFASPALPSRPGRSLPPDFAKPGFAGPSLAEPARLTFPCPAELVLAEPGFAKLGFAEPGLAQLAFPEPGFAEPGFAGPGLAEPARPISPCPAELGLAEPGFPELGFAEPGFAEPGFAEPGLAEPARLISPCLAEPGFPKPGFAELGFPEPGFPEPGFAEPGFPKPGLAAPARLISPCLAELGFPEPGFPEPGFAEPSLAEPARLISPAQPAGRRAGPLRHRGLRLLLRGTGDFQLCRERLRPLLNRTNGTRGSLNGLQSSEFYGFSEFYYCTEDVLRMGGDYSAARFARAAQVRNALQSSPTPRGISASLHEGFKLLPEQPRSTRVSFPKTFH
uniref:Uncharacterized protein n=1 Tax=Chloebia gouldiae TaxID=44316 RepID=A0A3L8Q7N5_CHLGU|nr:hypothetical protein DV515_00018668 [Chloebia gouldiae]